MSTENDRNARGQAGAGTGLTKLYMALGVAAVLGVGIVGYAVGRGTTGEAATAPITIEGIDDPTRLTALAVGITKGDDDAPVTIIEFGDHQCPSCAAFALQEKPQIDLGLVATGKAKFVFYDFPLVNMHPHAFLAGRAARCAGDQGRYWDYQDHLFRTQPRWATLINAAPMFEEFARSLDMDEGEFSACLNSDRHAELVTANLALAEALQLNQTPTVLIEHGGTATRVAPVYASIEEHVNELLATP